VSSEWKDNLQSNITSTTTERSITVICKEDIYTSILINFSSVLFGIIVTFISQYIVHYFKLKSINPEQIIPSPTAPLQSGNNSELYQLEMKAKYSVKPPIFFDKMSQQSFIDNSLASSAYSKSRQYYAVHLATLVFTPRERLESIGNNQLGKKALDTQRLMAIQNTLFKYYPCYQSTQDLNNGEFTKNANNENNVWLSQCLPAINDANRELTKKFSYWTKKNKQNTSKNKNNETASSTFQNTVLFSSSNSFNEIDDNINYQCLVNVDEPL